MAELAKVVYVSPGYVKKEKGERQFRVKSNFDDIEKYLLKILLQPFIRWKQLITIGALRATI
jgi:hypothetical protein